MSEELKPTADQIAALKGVTDETLAKWWCMLNRWGWPRRLHGHSADTTPQERWAVMNWIVKRIGKIECLKEWNHRKDDDNG